MTHTTAPTQASLLLNGILQRNGLEQPDGRNLRLYEITTDEYESIRYLLGRVGFMIECGHEQSTALMVLYISEWFRREATSTKRSWDQSGVVPNGLISNANARTEAVQTALRWWKVGLEQTDRGREPLLSLALQGGIPIHILRQGLNSTLARYFRQTMAHTWAKWPLDRTSVLEIAEAERGALIQTLRNPMIEEQAAEAVHVLCDLRKKLPHGLAKELVVPWLNANAPEWRAQIPLYLPDDEVALDALFCEMLTEPPARIPGSARILRMLVRHGEQWRPGIVLPDNAELPEGTFGLDGLEEGRFELTLIGEAARAFVGTLGQVYWRPGRGAISAMLTCDLGGAARRPVSGISPATPVMIRLTRSDIEPRIETWPGGDAVRSEVIAYRELSDGYAVLAGRGSVSSAADCLLVMTPKDASVTALEGEADRIDEISNAALWRLKGVVTIETAEGRYRVACGEEADARMMTLSESWIPGLQLDDQGLTLVQKGSLPKRSHEEGRVVLNGDAADCGTGRLVWAWLDADGFSIDRQRVLVLPNDFEIEAREGETGGIRVTWNGLPGWRIRVCDGPAQDGARGSVHTNTERVSRVSAVLVDPVGRETKCQIDLTVRDPHLANRMGARAGRNEQITLAEMSDWILRLPRQETLDLMLRGADGKPILIGIGQEGDVPLHELHGTAQLMLALAASQDAWIELEVRGRRLCTLTRPRLMLEDCGPYLTAPLGIDLDRPDLQAVVRPFDDGTREYSLRPVREGVWEAPDMAQRPAISYLRTTGGTLTRARFLSGTGLARDALSVAMEIADPLERENTIGLLLDSAVEDAELLKRLRSMVTSLRGLPPMSLDALRLLDGRHDTLAAMLISASEQEREDILALERHLPFLWMNIAKPSWQRAVNAQFDGMIAASEAAGLHDAVPMVTQAMNSTFEQLSENAPWFAAIRRLLGNGPDPQGDLGEIVRKHLRTHGDRGNKPMSLAGVVERTGVRLPPAIAAVNWQEHPTLLAPLVLALRVVSDIEMDLHERWRLRHALLFDRTYVTEAFQHCVADYDSTSTRLVKRQDRVRGATA